MMHQKKAWTEALRAAHPCRDSHPAEMSVKLHLKLSQIGRHPLFTLVAGRLLSSQASYKAVEAETLEPELLCNNAAAFRLLLLLNLLL